MRQNAASSNRHMSGSN